MVQAFRLMVRIFVGAPMGSRSAASFLLFAACQRLWLGFCQGILHEYLRSRKADQQWCVDLTNK